MGLYGFPDAPLDATGQQQAPTSSVDAHAQQCFRHDTQHLPNQYQHLPYGIAHIRHHGFPASGYPAVHLPDSGIGRSTTALTSPEGYHRTLDYCQIHASDRYGFPHVDQHLDTHSLPSFSLPTGSPPSFSQPSLRGSTMVHMDTGSVSHLANAAGGQGQGPTVMTTANSSFSESLPELRPRDTQDPLPATTSSSTVQFAVRSEQVDAPNEGGDGVVDTNRGNDGSRAGAGGHPAETGQSTTKAPNFVFNPPDLARWRQRLFDLNETVVMTNAE